LRCFASITAVNPSSCAPEALFSVFIIPFIDSEILAIPGPGPRLLRVDWSLNHAGRHNNHRLAVLSFQRAVLHPRVGECVKKAFAFFGYFDLTEKLINDYENTFSHRTYYVYHLMVAHQLAH
jgi:hypothetical protein